MDDNNGDNGGMYSLLAGVPAETMVDQRGLSKALGRCEKTIRRMVLRGELPAPIRFGGRGVWLAGKVRAWLNEAAEKAEADQRRELGRLGRSA